LNAAREFTQAWGGNPLVAARPGLTGYRVCSSEKTYTAAQPGVIRTCRDNASGYTLPMNRTLIIVGLLVALCGVLWKPMSALPLFRLPGDFIIDRPGFKFFFPLTTMILVSLIVSIVLWLFRR
jgi:hypothetical protein